MKFPVKVFARKNSPIFSTIYGRTPARPTYRVAWRVDGRRLMQSFARFKGSDGALEFAQKKARQLASGSKLAALTPKQASDALIAVDTLKSFKRATGQEIELVEAVRGYLDAVKKLEGNHSLTEAVEGFNTTVALIKQVPLEDAALAFLAEKDSQTKPKDGERAKLTVNYADMTRRFVEKFTNAYTGHMISDLQPAHLNAFMASKDMVKLAARSRNHHRNAIRTLLRWCVEQELLTKAKLDKLLKAEGMRKAKIDELDPEFYRPGDLKKLLNGADEEIRPVIALCGLAGMRTAEALKISWEEVFKRADYVSIEARIAKGDNKRLVKCCNALKAWLEPYRSRKGKVWGLSEKHYHGCFNALRKKQKIDSIKNGLRHAWATYHFALWGEESTAQQAGHDKNILHGHYKGLATDKEARAWFEVMPRSKDLE